MENHESVNTVKAPLTPPPSPPPSVGGGGRGDHLLCWQPQGRRCIREEGLFQLLS